MSVKQKFAASSMWLLLGATVGQLSAFVIFVLLARILTPAEFGIVALASLFIDLIKQFLASGIPDALIRHPEWDDDLASTAFWINIGMAVAMALLCLGIGVPLFETLGYAGVGPVFAVLTVTLVIDAMRIVLDARLRRNFDFKLLTSREMITQAIAGVIGIVLALAGAGVWALVVNRLAASVMGTVATYWLVRWHPRLHFSHLHARHLLRFSSGLVGAQTLATLNSQVAPLIIGFFLGPTALAYFRTGSRFLTMLTQVTITPLQGAALSAFSRIKETGALAPVYLRLTSTCSLVACPVFFGAGVMAPDLVRLLLGPQWNDSGYIMMVSAFVVGASALNYFFTPALTAAGNTRYSFQYYLSAVIGNAVLAVLTTPLGTVAVAASQTARAYLNLPLPLFYLKKTIGLSPWAALRSIAAPFISAVAMGALMWAARMQWMQDFAPWLRIVCMSAVGAVSYALGMLLIGRNALRANWSELKPLLPKSIRSRFP